MVSPSSDNSAIASPRLTLDELFTDQRFFVRESMFACQVAEYILTLVQQGERDPIFSKLQRSKSSQARSRCR
jgi:hypothetical protein